MAPAMISLGSGPLLVTAATASALGVAGSRPSRAREFSGAGLGVIQLAIAGGTRSRTGATGTAAIVDLAHARTSIVMKPVNGAVRAIRARMTTETIGPGPLEVPAEAAGTAEASSARGGTEAVLAADGTIETAAAAASLARVVARSPLPFRCAAPAPRTLLGEP